MLQVSTSILMHNIKAKAQLKLKKRTKVIEQQFKTNRNIKDKTEYVEADFKEKHEGNVEILIYFSG